MTAGIPAVTAPAPDRLQAAVNDAAKRLYDAEAALHIARQTGVGSWISAAYDRLHEAVAGHTVAVDALQDRYRAVPPAPKTRWPPLPYIPGGGHRTSMDHFEGNMS
jgi:hypothetical protein